MTEAGLTGSLLTIGAATSLARWRPHLSNIQIKVIAIIESKRRVMIDVVYEMMFLYFISYFIVVVRECSS